MQKAIISNVDYEESRLLFDSCIGNCSFVEYWCQSVCHQGLSNLHQGRGDGPKAGTSGASEAARAKPGAQTGVCFAYPKETRSPAVARMADRTAL